MTEALQDGDRWPEPQADAWADSRADTRWLSYDDLSEILGVKRESVIRMVRRKRWPKRPGNEPGSVRVEVPLTAIEAMQARNFARPLPEPPAPDEVAAADQSWTDMLPILRDAARAITKLEAALVEVRAERDQLQMALDQQCLATDHARAGGEQIEAAADDERQRAAVQRARLDGQVIALATELARIHAFPRPVPQRRAKPRATLLGRVASFARWLHQGI